MEEHIEKQYIDDLSTYYSRRILALIGPALTVV